MATNREKMDEISERLEKGIKDVFTSEKYTDYLKIMSKFHKYSYRNSLLIMLQNPKATKVAGYNTWKKDFNRQVNKGEKGLQILAPTPYRKKKEVDKLDPKTNTPIKDSSGNTLKEVIEVKIPSFKPTHVFDVSQTTGEPLPKLTTELTGKVEEYEILYSGLESVSPFPVSFEQIQGGAKGYCDPVNEKIVINSGMSQTQTIKTAIHEITHADLHAPEQALSFNEKTDRGTREVEAESVAYILCDHFGIDTSDYSFPYLASWSQTQELDELKNSLGRIQNQAAELLDRIETSIIDLTQEHTIASRSTDDIIPFPHTIAESKEFVRVQIQEDFYNNKITQSQVDYLNKDISSIESKVHERFQETSPLTTDQKFSFVSDKLKETLVNYPIPKERTFTIYQLPNNKSNLFLKFENIASLQKNGLTPEYTNYSKVYTGTLEPNNTLESIYQEFNINHPEDYTGHSLSVSDIVVISSNTQNNAYYVDSIGFKEVPDFAKEYEKFNFIKFDNDMDMDRYKSKEKLGIKEKKLSIKERLDEAKTKSENIEKKKIPNIDRGAR